MQTFIRSIMLVALFTIATQTGYGCYCVKPEAAEAFARAGAVFVGEVVGITEPRTTNPDAPFPDHLYVIKFKVEKSWKGAEFARALNVLSAQGQYNCFAHRPVSKGERYLIYANLWNGWLSINNCSRTALITDPITPADRLQSRTEVPRRNYLSPGPAANGVDPAADLRLLESLLFPTFAFKYKLGRDVDRLPFLNFTEPEPNLIKK